MKTKYRQQPHDWRLLKAMADHDCACRGEGRLIKKVPGKKGKFVFIPCACTQRP